MRSIHTTVLFFALTCVLSSCDFLAREDPGSIPEDDIYSDPALMQLFVNNMYLDVPGFDHQLYDNITDESRTYWGGGPLDVIEGRWLADYNPMEYWRYDAVRKTNMFLSNIDEAEVDEELRASLKGQVKFLRALHYFNMIKRYGGVPIITEPQSLTDDLMVERQTTDASFEFVISELEEAIELLPETYGGPTVDVGKANKWSAKAFLGRVLLFWASPLYNPDGDVSRWEYAATVNKEIIDSGVYELHGDFRRIMLDKNNEEEIFSVQYQKTFREHGWDSWHQPDSQSKNDAVRRSPVQEFVDAFEMKNGKSIADPASGYDPERPYDNRDPRLQATVIVNGSMFMGNTINMSVNSPTKDRILGPYATITGYLMRKGTDESNMDYFGGSGSDQNWIELRFAEVLLNYAEAKNEILASPDQSVYDAVNLVRERAGLEPHQLPTGLSKEEMRERIRHERYIELAFEQKRYWDLRRWKAAVETLDGKTFHAMHMTQHEDGSSTYETKPIIQGPYVFEEHMYFMPIPQREIDKNPNLTQNPGW